MTTQRLIEHYIPIKAISAEASREKSIRHGHISTLHLWWARRPLVASRAAVFASLVAADAQPQLIDESTGQPFTLTRFMIELCKWNLSDAVLEEARRLIREAYPDQPPKVLDMFAGGGSIPLEALRLGCEAYALDLNPVAHLIELATLVYPQKYGKVLAEDVKMWGNWVLQQVRAEVGDLYPLIPDSEYSSERAKFFEALPVQGELFPSGRPRQLTLDEASVRPEMPPTPDLNISPAPNPSPIKREGLQDDSFTPSLLVGEGAGDGGDEALDDPDIPPDAIPPGFLQPVAYLWTRTVTCPNPACRAAVPLVRQTWLKKKKGDNIALAMLPHPSQNRMRFEVRRAHDPQDFGFDPAGFSQRGSSLCGRCGTTVTTTYIKQEGKAGRMGAQMMATVCVRAGGRGKVYLSPDEQSLPLPDEDAIRARIEALTAETGITPPEEPLPEKLTGGMCTLYGLDQFYKLFTPRQLLTLLTFVKGVRGAHAAMIEAGMEDEYAKAVTTYLGLALNRLVSILSTQSRWRGSEGERVVGAFARQAIPMMWDFAETMPFNPVFTSWKYIMEVGIAVIDNVCVLSDLARVIRSSATDIPNQIADLDAVITDPPYYDNISYADLSDYFYVWLKRSLGFLYPEHLSADITPKKREAIAAPYRHQDDKDQARTFYESMMRQAFKEGYRVLKPDGFLVTVYAHKTTAGWSTLIDAMRSAGFAMTEAWPLDTELAGRAIAQDTAALASSFFLVARKREGIHTGDFLHEVQPAMRTIIRERVRFFLEQGITGADLNIAAVGAGLAPYTRYARVELPNGAELSAAAYLDEAQAEVVRVLLGEAAQTDPVTQYYIMGRSYYGEAWVDFDEANTLARATGIELDSGAHALTRGKASLIEKKGAKVRLRDYSERGESSSLGLPTVEGVPAPLVDVLHRLLWLVEHDHSRISDLLAEAKFDKYLLRLSAQTLSGRALAGEPTPGAVRDERTPEQRAIDSLLAGWRRIIDEGKMI